MTEIEYLEDKIRRANIAYWNDNAPIITDEEYDALVNDLLKLDPKNKLLQHIGGTKGKYRHTEPMLSLNKAYSKEEVLKWALSVARDSNREKFYIQPKYDGLAGKFENDHLVTRGDGMYGEDISKIIPSVTVINYNAANVCKTYTVEKYLHQQKLIDKTYYKFNKLAIRKSYILGELIIRQQIFDECFKSGKLLRADGKFYSNSRNAVAGLVNQKEPIPNGIITFIPYGCWFLEVSLNNIKDYFDQYINHVKQFCQEQGFPIDGVVFKLKDEQYLESLGNTAHHPRGQIAFKFTNESEWGIVDNVIWQSGKEVLTPVVVLESPIAINGSMILKATCHNLNQFTLFDLAKGDQVCIEKAGDVIPKLVRVDHTGNTNDKFKAPKKCPICGAKTIVQGTDLMCSNTDCSGKIIPRMVAAAKILKLTGFGPSTCELLHERLGINELWQLLETNYCEQIGYLPGFTDYSADLLYKSLKSAVGNVYEHEVFAALCIPGISIEIARKIFEKYDYDTFTSLSIESLTKLIGPTRAWWVIQAYHQRIASIVKMFRLFKPMKLTIIENSHLKEKICLTGKFEKPKAYYKQLIENAGYEYTDNLTDDVKYLVTNDVMRQSSKIDKAKKKNIEIITIDKLMERLNECNKSK